MPKTNSREYPDLSQRVIGKRKLHILQSLLMYVVI